MKNKQPRMNRRNDRVRFHHPAVLGRGRQGFSIVEVLFVGMAASLIATTILPSITGQQTSTQWTVPGMSS